MSLGIEWHNINEQAKMLIDDIVYWEKGSTDLSIFSQSIRFHHRLVKIHPFVNGNGRHARLASDIFLFTHNCKLPTWPSKALLETSDIRIKYIAALQEADKGNYQPLETFTTDLID